MAENYCTGKHRLVHRAKGFKESLTLTMDVLNPQMVWESKGLSLIEVGRGLYYIDYDFQLKGTYAAVIFDGVEKVGHQNFYIDVKNPTSNFFIGGSRGPSVINL